MIHTGDPDPGDQGVTLFQTTPDKISFQQGQDRLAVFSCGLKNILRWQASCCNAALFTTREFGDIGIPWWKAQGISCFF